jgi:hypothetical protein
MHVNKRYSWLFKLTSRGIKYYLLALFGFLITCVLAWSLGVFVALEPLLPSIIEWFVRIAAFLLCCMATTIVVESLR